MGNWSNWKLYNFWGWVLSLCCLLLVIYSFCAFRVFAIAYVWHFSPPRIVLVGVATIALIFGSVGVKGHAHRARSVFTILFSLGVILILVLSMAAFRNIRTTQSPNRQYTISLYSFDGGAFDSSTYYGYINGPLWFKKEFYFSATPDAPQIITWKNNFTIVVNNQSINLKAGQTYRG